MLASCAGEDVSHGDVTLATTAIATATTVLLDNIKSSGGNSRVLDNYSFADRSNASHGKTI
jgi:hypothetical protein